MKAPCLLIERLRATLPPTFSRRSFQSTSGGLIAASTLANLDSKGHGPGGTIVGRAIFYERESFLAWLEQRIAMKEAKTHE